MKYFPLGIPEKMLPSVTFFTETLCNVNKTNNYINSYYSFLNVFSCRSSSKLIYCIFYNATSQNLENS